MTLNCLCCFYCCPLIESRRDSASNSPYAPVDIQPIQGALQATSSKEMVAPLNGRVIPLNSNGPQTGTLTLSDSDKNLASIPLKQQFEGRLANCLAALVQLTGPLNEEEEADQIEILQKNNKEIAELITEFLESEKKRANHPIIAVSISRETSEDLSIPVETLTHNLRAPIHEIGLKIDEYNGTEASSRNLRDLTYSLEQNYKHVQRLVDQFSSDAIPGTKQKITADWTPFTFEKLEERLRSLVKRSAETQNISIDFEYPLLKRSDGKPIEFSGDATKITEILLNFTNNAIKYCKPGSKVTVKFDIEPGSEPPYHLIHFKVKDNGPGISPEKQQQLFTCFSQVGTLSDSSQESSGVGLYLCNRYVKLLNPTAPSHERIGVQSEIGKGSTFWFTARVKRIPDSTAPSPASPIPKVKAVFRNPNLSILWADDHMPTLKITDKLLETAGCAKGEKESSKRKTVQSGNEALIHCSTFQYDLIFLDENMGDNVMGGCEAAKAILADAKKNYRKPPHIVIITGDSKSQIEERLKKLEINAPIEILTKPVDYNTIVQTANRLIPD